MLDQMVHKRTNVQHSGASKLFSSRVPFMRTEASMVPHKIKMSLNLIYKLETQITKESEFCLCNMTPPTCSMFVAYYYKCIFSKIRQLPSFMSSLKLSIRHNLQLN